MRTQSDGPSKLQSVEMATINRESRNLFKSVLEQSGFEHHWTQFMQTAQRIYNMRLLEHLGRFTTRAAKESKVLDFQQLYVKLHQLLSAMVTSSENFQRVRHQTQKASDGHEPGEMVANRQEQQRFNQNIKRQVNCVLSRWCQIFRQGSLKRLIPILCMLRMNDHNMTTHFDIEQWSRTIRKNLLVDEVRQRYCCWVVNHH